MFAAADLSYRSSYDSANYKRAWLKAKVIRSSILSAEECPDACSRASFIEKNHKEFSPIMVGDRHRRRTRNRQRIRGIRDNDGGDGGSTTAPRNLQQQYRCQRRKMTTNATITTPEVLTEDRRRVQGIVDDGGGGSGFLTSPMDYQ